MRSFSSTTSLKVSATLPAIPVHSIGSRAEKSPFFREVRAERRACVSVSCVGSSWTAGMGILPLYVNVADCRRSHPSRAVWRSLLLDDRGCEEPLFNRQSRCGDHQAQGGTQLGMTPGRRAAAFPRLH